LSARLLLKVPQPTSDIALAKIAHIFEKINQQKDYLNNFQDMTLSIGETAKELGVSVDTYKEMGGR
jgi:hypothetical protein